MRKALSIITVVLCLVCISYIKVASAADLWEDSAVEIWAFEQLYGSYEHWPIALKRSLVMYLRWQDLIEETPNYIALMTEGSAAGMSSHDAHVLADHIISEAVNRPLQEITTFTITEAVWGDETSWNDSQTAFWQELEMEVHLKISPELLITTVYDEQSYKDALEIAKNENITAFSLGDDFFADQTMISQVQYISPINQHVCWLILLEKQVDTNSHNIRYFWASIDTVSGTCLSDNKLGIFSPQERANRLQQRIKHDSDTPLRLMAKQFYMDQAAQGYYRFADYPLSVKAQFSLEISPLIRDAIAMNSELIFDNERAIASFEYGMPDDKNIPEQEAVPLAHNYAINKWGNQEYLYGFLYFDVTDPNNSLWRIYFNTHGGNGTPDYCVELDAITGELVSAEQLDFSSMRYWDRCLHMQ